MSMIRNGIHSGGYAGKYIQENDFALIFEEKILFSWRIDKTILEVALV